MRASLRTDVFESGLESATGTAQRKILRLRHLLRSVRVRSFARRFGLVGIYELQNEWTDVVAPAFPCEIPLVPRALFEMAGFFAVW